MSKEKFEVNDLVLIYEKTDTFIDGALAKVLDRDPNDNSYLVATLEAVFAENGDVSKLLKNHAKWVKNSNIKKILFTRENNRAILVKLAGFMLCSGLLGFLIGYGL